MLLHDEGPARIIGEKQNLDEIGWWCLRDALAYMLRHATLPNELEEQRVARALFGVSVSLPGIGHRVTRRNQSRLNSH